MYGTRWVDLHPSKGKLQNTHCIVGDIKGNMSLDKAMEHGKEHREPYRGEKEIDPSCRNHGSCKWCENNRKHKFRDKILMPTNPGADDNDY